MKNEIYKPIAQQEKDQQVPGFGGYKVGELQPAQQRSLKPDVFAHKAYQQLQESAVERAIFFAYGKGILPPVHFPNAEHFQHNPFTKSHWQQYGNLESEYARIHFVLDNYPSRGFPQEFLPQCKAVLGSENVLGDWGIRYAERVTIVRKIFKDISLRMYAARSHEVLQYHNGLKGAYESQPIFYESLEEVRSLQKRVWLIGLSQITQELAQGNTKHVKDFLELYQRMKDPITCVITNLDEQVHQFNALYKICSQNIPQKDRNPQSDAILISQLALEASFLALPKANEIFAALYEGHHELPYLYVSVEKLPRGELANPRRVREVVRDILEDSNRYSHPVVTPLAVSYFQHPEKQTPELCILDGNNRATALLLFKYIHSCGYNREKSVKRQTIDAFVKQHRLAIAWERDMVLALNTLDKDDWEQIYTNKKYITAFAKGSVPALLVQEPNFNTIAVAKSHGSRIVLLQPMHQVLYNQREFPIAIPSKEQSHGRALGNDVRIGVKEK